MKTCFKCKESKPLTEFYRHKMMADGHLGKCKECAKADVIRNRAAKVDYYRAYDAKRFKDDPRVKERHEKYAKSEAGKASVNKSKRRWTKENPDKHAAHVILGNAVRDGRIEKPDTCSDCGKPHRTIHGHHKDYAYPLDVIWLCPPCHKKLHKAHNEPAP